MAKSGAYWKGHPKSFMDTVKADTRQKAIDMADTILKDVTSHSPVDTGAFQTSWRVSADSPVFVYNEPGDGGSGGFRGNAFTYPAKFTKLFVTNGAPYGIALEYGWSDKAPTGVLRNAIARL